MPTYLFSCQKCNREFQVKISWREKDAVRCPSCDSNELKELLGRYSVHVNSPAATTAAVPERCQGCENRSSGCPMAH